MRCPHCLNHFHDTLVEQPILNTDRRSWFLLFGTCPACEKLILFLRDKNQAHHGLDDRTRLIFPDSPSRIPLAKEIPNQFAAEYEEAAEVLPISAKASAALSRRCLQQLIRQEAKIHEKTLYQEIEKLIASNAVPTSLAEQLHAIREIGNFAAHPLKDTNTGEIVDVEPGEAEWLLDLLDSLFDLYFVQPAKAKKRKAELNKKLLAANKQPLK